MTITRTIAPKPSHACLISLGLLLAFNLNDHPSFFANAWSLWPAHYIFNIENAFKNATLKVHCKSKDEDFGVVPLPVHGNFTHRLKSDLLATKLYFCGLTIPKKEFKVFDVFKDMQDFVDKECGGRHCFWRAQEDGIYLYQIHKEQYVWKYGWDPYNSTSKPKGISI